MIESAEPLLEMSRLRSKLAGMCHPGGPQTRRACDDRGIDSGAERAGTVIAAYALDGWLGVVTRQSRPLVNAGL